MLVLTMVKLAYTLKLVHLLSKELSNLSKCTNALTMFECDMTTDCGGWIVIQRNKISSPVDFNRNWTDYKEGFGDLNTEFWHGLSAVHCLTQRGQWEMRVDYKKIDKTWSYCTSTTISSVSHRSMIYSDHQYQLLCYRYSTKHMLRNKVNDRILIGTSNLIHLQLLQICIQSSKQRHTNICKHIHTYIHICTNTCKHTSTAS